MTNKRHEELTKTFFNEWADQGKGASMARGHAVLVEEILTQAPPEGNRVLDVGCGIGKLLEQASRQGAVGLAGIDVADHMIEIAKTALPEADMKTGSVEALPWTTETFDKVYSVEAMYYFSELAKTLKEINRVLKPGGQFISAIEYYEENEGSQIWAEELPMHVHLLSENAWKQEFEKAGFKTVTTARIKRETPKPETEFNASPFFPSYARYLNYIQEGALLVTGTK